MATMVKRKY